MNRPIQETLFGILSAVADGTASEAQVDELTRLLQSDAEARRFYVRYMDMHAALASGNLPRGNVRGRRTPWGFMVASLLAASLLVAWIAVSRLKPGALGDGAQASRMAEAAPAGYVATIASCSADAILDGKAAAPGARLTLRSYHLTAGNANIRFDGGARILLEGSTRFEIHSRRVMRIDEGTFVFHGDQTCESIEVITPHSVFKNIGTRYAAVVDSLREEVHVAEGAVRRTTGSDTEPKRHELIEAGVGRRYGLSGDSGESIPLDGVLVARSLDTGTPMASADSAVAMDDFRGGAARIDGLNSGTGWIGPWESRRGDLRLSSPGLSGGDSSALVHDGTAKDAAAWRSAAHRKLGSPVDLSADGMYYVRFLVRRGPAAPRDEHRATLVLRLRGLTTQEELDQGTLIQIALRKHDGVLLRVADTITRASIPQVPGQAYAVVAKIVAGRSEPDQVLVSVMAADRLEGSAEPAEWSLVSEGVDSNLRLDKLSLEFASGGRIDVGGLCIGPTWAGVTQPLEP